MKFTVKTGDFSNKDCDCLIVGVFEKEGLSKAAKKLDQLSKGFISAILKRGDLQGKIDQSLTLYHVPNTDCERLILVGCGKEDELDERNFRKIIACSVRALKASKSTAEAVTYLTEVNVTNKDLDWKIKQIVTVTSDILYSFNEFKSKKPPKTPLKEIALFVPEKNEKQALKTLKQSVTIAEGINFAKNLENLPSNICTPSYLAEKAKTLGKQYKKLHVKVLEQKDMKKLGMNALLAVAKGSAEMPKLICLEYKGAGKSKAPIVFVGKGVTFDTGGISLKPAESMVGMKYDMCGAACTMAVLKTAADLQLPLNIVGILAAVENMPSGTAVKPEDIVTTMSGQTVEILNTDAEGRLILCDALTYAERFKPSAVIDIATLTGAVVIALGNHATGLLSNNEKLADELLAAGNETYDRAWRLPLWDEYQDLIRSPFADMANIGGRTAGTITAACFLSRFAKKFPWAHLDVAGTAAMMFGNDRYATGRPIPMLMQFLLDRVA